MTGFKYFVGYHYTLSSRRDTKYWQYITEEIEMNPLMHDPQLNQIPNNVTEIAVKLIQSHYLPGDLSMGGIPDIFVGSNTLPVNLTQMKIMKDILVARKGTDPEFFMSSTQDYWNQKKEYINGLAETAPSHYDYLKETIYNGKE
jgi:hypothetical protein